MLNYVTHGTVTGDAGVPLINIPLPNQLKSAVAQANDTVELGAGGDAIPATVIGAIKNRSGWKQFIRSSLD